jgi:dephospho-CoA kinase
MGKSTSADFFAERGLRVIDTDVIARQLVEPGQSALSEIATAFGEDMLGPDGQLKRDALAKRVFSDPIQRKRLESILHPRIREHWLNEVKQLAQKNVDPCVVVIPLLFETGAESQFDHVISVACSAGAQHERLQARGWTSDQIQQRIAAQWPIGKKIAASQFVISTEGSLETHSKQIDQILAAVTAGKVNPANRR